MGEHLTFQPLTENRQTTPYVYLALNVEESRPDGVGHGFTSHKFDYDLKNHTWRLYGLREGIENIVHQFASLDIPLSFLVNSNALDQVIDFPALIQSLNQVEIIGHGKSNAYYFHELSEAEQIEQAGEVKFLLEKHFGLSVKGWLSPWINGSNKTIDALKAAGYQYTLDWACSDYAGQVNSADTSLLSIPYNIEINDTPSLCAKSLSVEDYKRSVYDYINGLALLPDRGRAPVVALPLHAPVIGRPHRLVHLVEILTELKRMHEAGRIILTTPSGILSYLQVNSE